MTKLHELLAVKPTREGEADNIMKKHTASFKGELHLFSKTKKVFSPATETADGKAQDVVEEDRPLVTSVAKEARFALEKLAECVDLNYTIDVANTEAKADIVVDGDTIEKNVPASFLVHLEKRLNQCLKLVEDMATADPAAGYQPDPSEGPYALKANDIRRARTNKIERWEIVAPATDKHPAQVQKITTDEVVGYVTTFNWTTLPTTHQKSEMIAHVVKLRDAVVAARARANCHDIEQKKIFGKFVDYILKPLA